MIYSDGYEVDGNLRFVRCPKCGNEEYSADAKFCKICGFPAYNECEGSPEYDNFGNVEDFKFIRMLGMLVTASIAVSRQCFLRRNC